VHHGRDQIVCAIVEAKGRCPYAACGANRFSEHGKLAGPVEDVACLCEMMFKSILKRCCVKSGREVDVFCSRSILDPHHLRQQGPERSSVK
jgi:hypothetical protein